MLAMAHFTGGEQDRAIQLLKHVIDKHPQEFSAYLNLGFVYQQQKHWQEAVHYTKKALQLNPASTQAQAQLERVQALLQKKPPR